MAIQRSHWTGISGQTYSYYVHLIGKSFRSSPGNYIFARQISPTSHEAIYIGQSVNLKELSDNHPKMRSIIRKGATHVHVHEGQSGKTIRTTEEQDLISHYRPPCNY